VPEQRLDDVHRGVTVEVLGGEHPPTVVRRELQRPTVAAGGAGVPLQRQ